MRLAIPGDTLTDLYQNHHGWLFRWLCQKLGCADHAADLAHDTYARLLIGGRLPEPAQSRAYLMRIAKGFVIDLRRRRRLEMAYLDALARLPEQQAPSAEAQVIVIETLVRIDAVLRQCKRSRNPRVAM